VRFCSEVRDASIVDERVRQMHRAKSRIVRRCNVTAIRTRWIEAQSPEPVRLQRPAAH
jgi:hypothetical protein